MNISKIKYESVVDEMAVKRCLSDMDLHAINHVNWEDQYPYCPKVNFKIAHDGERLFIWYFVEEEEILARVEHDNGKVWTDSCVEFFISFNQSPYYYNAEFNCIGKALVGYRKIKNEVTHADAHVTSQILRFPSLGHVPFDLRKGGFKWDMLLVIPVSVFWKSELSSFDGVEARGNFYKCGDNLDNPYFISWNAIETEAPNFHTPLFFGDIKFD